MKPNFKSEIVNRFDRGIDLSSTVIKTDEGYLKITAPVARVGIYRYRTPDGSIRKELVSEDTLFNADSMESLKMKPVTNRHPQEKLLNSTNVKKRNVGAVGETVKKDGIDLLVNFIVTDGMAIGSIDKGRQELSPGYKCQLDFTPGEFEGERYDAVQINRTYNHLAVVDKARGGSDMRINLDDEDAEFLYCLDADIEELPKQGESNMKQMKIGSTTVEVSDDVKAHCDSLQANLDTVTGERDELQTKNDSLVGEKSTLQTKVDSFDDELTTKTDEAVKERVSLVVSANDLFNTDSAEDKAILTKVDSMDNKDLKKAIILKVQPSAQAKLDDDDVATDAYINTRFDSALEIIEEDKKKEEEDLKNGALNKSRSNLKPKATVKKDAEDESPEQARENMIKADSMLWNEENKGE